LITDKIFLLIVLFGVGMILDMVILENFDAVEFWVMAWIAFHLFLIFIASEKTMRMYLKQRRERERR